MMMMIMIYKNCIYLPGCQDGGEKINTNHHRDGEMENAVCKNLYTRRTITSKVRQLEHLRI
jgi:hypothetical protein